MSAAVYLAGHDRQSFDAWAARVGEHADGDLPGLGLRGRVEPTQAHFHAAAVTAESKQAWASLSTAGTVGCTYSRVSDQAAELVGFLSLRHPISSGLGNRSHAYSAARHPPHQRTR